MANVYIVMRDNTGKIIRDGFYPPFIRVFSSVSESGSYNYLHEQDKGEIEMQGVKADGKTWFYRGPFDLKGWYEVRVSGEFTGDRYKSLEEARKAFEKAGHNMVLEWCHPVEDVDSKAGIGHYYSLVFELWKCSNSTGDKKMSSMRVAWIEKQDADEKALETFKKTYNVQRVDAIM